MEKIKDSIIERETRWDLTTFFSMLSKDEKDVDRDAFISYYTKVFPKDIKKYYDIKVIDCKQGYPSIVITSDFIKKQRSTVKWKSLYHYYMFSVSVYYMTMCSQVIGHFYGWQQMENFLKASSWPIFDKYMAGYVHPIDVIYYSQLFPKHPFDDYLKIYHVAGDYLRNDFLDFFKDGVNCLNAKAHKELCVIFNKDEVLAEINRQESLYEQWVLDADVTYPNIYIQYPNE